MFEFSIKLKTIFEQVERVSSYLFTREWAERNGGNLSINVTEEMGTVLNEELERAIFVEDARVLDALKGCSFFITGTGLRMRDLVGSKMAQNACILRISECGQGYHILWGGHRENFRPTSELSTHFAIHLNLINRGGKHKALLHTHPHELIAMTHNRKLCETSDILTHNLWKMIPEVRLFVPKGAAFIPYEMAGSQTLADKSLIQLEKRDVLVWEKHGALATGVDLDDAFDYVDVANKGAKVYLQCLSAGFEPEGLAIEQMQELEERYLKK